MKLLYILDRLSQGGISTVLIHRLNFLAKVGNFEIHILTEIENDLKIQKQFNSSITFHTINYLELSQKKRLRFFGFFGLQKELKREFQNFIEQLKPDIISAFNLEAMNNFIIPYLKIDAIKIIEFHGAYQPKRGLIKRKIITKESNIRKLKRLVFHPVNFFIPSSKNLHNKYDYGIVLTKEDAENRKSYLRIKIRHIFNFMLVNKNIKPFDQRENIIIGVGRMVQQKNLLDLVEAVNLIRENLSNWKVHIYGDGEQYNLINKKIINYGLENIVLLKGFSYNMKDVYNDSKILVTPALWEGQPMNILEAFSYKIPVISYDCKCGPKEIIREGVNGFLVDFNVEELASRMLKLTADSKLLKSFSSKTLIDMKLFELDTVMNEWAEFYYSIFEEEQSQKL